MKTIRDIRKLAAEGMGVRPGEIEGLSRVKAGMTNYSFLFSCRGERYIVRIPGEGTDRLIDRRKEADAYHTISGLDICDDPVYLDPDTGCMISRFLEHARVCDPASESDLRRCMELLRRLHGMKLKVGHEFDIFGQIEYYQGLWDGVPSIYPDHADTTRAVFALRPYIEAHCGEKVLTHIDAVPDNFIFFQRDGAEQLRLIDWEYAGMQDPHVDIAMFCIYALYDHDQIERLISIYFDGACPPELHKKIYCCIAACGLLWSNWCEYKKQLGVDFGEYSLRQYQYARDYSRLARESGAEL